MVARVCRSSDERANEAIVTRVEDETKTKQFDPYRMKLEPRESCQPSSGSGDWLMGFRPAEISRCEERLLDFLLALLFASVILSMFLSTDVLSNRQLKLRY